MKSLIGLFLLLILWSCNGQNDKISPDSTAPRQFALVKSPNSIAFNNSFKELLNAYWGLKESVIAEKDSAMNQSARAMIQAADSLKLNEIKADSNLIFTARTYSEGISSELIGLIGEKEMLSKRRSFQMVSDQLYDLIRTVQYDQALLFHAYCNNAFDDQGAYWICLPNDTQNPYLPKNAKTCCEIKDTIPLGTVHN